MPPLYPAPAGPTQYNGPVQEALLVLGVLGLVGLVFVAMLVASILIPLRLLHRRNRISPSARTGAPLHWLSSPSGAARLHRRLQRAISAGRMAVAARAGDSVAADVIAELERHACAIDCQLVVADRAPKCHRNRMLRELAAETSEVEALVVRVLRVNRAWDGSSPSARNLVGVHDRLDALEQAVGVLDGIDRLPEIDCGGGGPAQPGAAAARFDTRTNPSSTPPA